MKAHVTVHAKNDMSRQRDYSGLQIDLCKFGTHSPLLEYSFCTRISKSNNFQHNAIWKPEYELRIRSENTTGQKEIKNWK